MIFIEFAMVYYGLILYNLRSIKKIKDAVVASAMTNEDQLSNSIIRWDRLVLVIYIAIFILFNVYYFSKYYIF